MGEYIFERAVVERITVQLEPGPNDTEEAALESLLDGDAGDPAVVTKGSWVRVEDEA